MRDEDSSGAVLQRSVAGVIAVTHRASASPAAAPRLGEVARRRSSAAELGRRSSPATRAKQHPEAAVARVKLAGPDRHGLLADHDEASRRPQSSTNASSSAASKGFLIDYFPGPRLTCKHRPSEQGRRSGGTYPPIPLDRSGLCDCRRCAGQIAPAKKRGKRGKVSHQHLQQVGTRRSARRCRAPVRHNAVVARSAVSSAACDILGQGSGASTRTRFPIKELSTTR